MPDDSGSKWSRKHWISWQRFGAETCWRGRHVGATPPVLGCKEMHSPQCWEADWSHQEHVHGHPCAAAEFGGSLHSFVSRSASHLSLFTARLLCKGAPDRQEEEPPIFSPGALGYALCEFLIETHYVSSVTLTLSSSP